MATKANAKNVSKKHSLTKKFPEYLTGVYASFWYFIGATGCDVCLEH